MRDIHGMLPVVGLFLRISHRRLYHNKQKDVEKFQDWEFSDTLILVIVRT